MFKLITMTMLLAAVGCVSESTEPMDWTNSDGKSDSLQDEVVVLETYDVSQLNTDLVDGEPTADMAFYVTEEGPIQWDELTPSIDRAKRIFSAVGVQLRVSSALLVSLPPEWQTLDSSELDVPINPDLLETDLYAHLNELGARLTARNRAILEAVISHHPDQASGVSKANTIHVLTLNKVPISYYEWTGTDWVRSEVATGGLSFPPYMHADRIPMDIRGVITLSSRPNRLFPEARALAHEIGHKIINVSHEGVGVCPTFAVRGPDLMLYGDAERIADGAEGRWQRERLLLSPFLYQLQDGSAEFANVYQDGGIYRDRLYGDYVVDPPCADSSQ